MIFAKLNATGYLSDMRSGPQQPGGVWLDGSQDVPLAAMPAPAPLDTQYTYDAVNQLAVPLSPTDQASFDTAQERTQATALVGDPQAQLKVLRALMLTAMDEINILREWLTSFKTQVAAASSLADLKTRIAGLPDTPDRTAVQLRTAITNKISGGAADN